MHSLKKARILIFVLSVFLTYSPLARSQGNTLYYMENVPFRNALNPAFVPTQTWYLDLPILSNINIWAGNNSVSAADLFFKQNGKLITPFHPDANRDAFLKVLQPTTDINLNYDQQLLGFGFRARNNYFTFGVNQRIESSVGIPKDLLKLLLKGTPDSTGVNNFNFQSLRANVTAYLETSVGFTRSVNSKLTIGGKVKFLLGEAHADSKFSNLNLRVDKQAAILTGNGYGRITAPYNISQNEDGTPKELLTKEALQMPIGWGLATDLGVVYKLRDNFTLSASLSDLGFIRWKKTSWKADMTYKATFTGMDFEINGDNNDYGKQMSDSLKNAFTYSGNGAGYTTYLTAKARLGAEYGLVKNKISLGLIWENTLGGNYKYSELTGSVNFRPFYFFNTSFSYGAINGRLGTFGVGVNLIGGPFNLYFASDYVPAYFTKDGIPYNSKYIDAHIGLVLTFGHGKKSKKEEIYDEILDVR